MKTNDIKKESKPDYGQQLRDLVECIEKSNERIKDFRKEDFDEYLDIAIKTYQNIESFYKRNPNLL